VKEQSPKTVGTRTKGSMCSSSLFKFTEGEAEAENIIKIAQQKFLIAFVKITSLGSMDLRVEEKADALVAISSTIIQRSVCVEKCATRNAKFRKC